jgi:hypothetical protein
VDTKDRELHNWEKGLDHLEEHVLSERCKLIHVKAQNAQLRWDVHQCFKKAGVGSLIHDRPAREKAE